MAPQKSPAFSFYAKDFLSGTATMSLEEVGAYVKFLAYQWDAGSIPASPRERTRILGCTAAQERTVWAKLSTKFLAIGDAYQNERLESERRKQADRRQRLSDNGKLGGRPQKANGKLDESKSFSETKANENLNKRLSSSSSFSSSEKDQKQEHNDRASRLDAFETWWSAYPKKTGKGAAQKAWSKINPSGETFSKMIGALEWQRTQPQWTKDGGAFIPNPATYLNQARWDDEPFFTTTTPDDSEFLQQLEAAERGERQH